MPSLFELQHLFARSLRDNQEAVLENYIQEHGLAPVQRLAIYRQQFLTTFYETLRTVYSAIYALVGEQCFKALAHEYARSFPSISGDLWYFGAQFAHFLATNEQTKKIPYLAEVAYLEWLRHEVAAAPTSQPFDFTTLKELSLAQQGEIKFDLHPAMRLGSFEFPVLAIWQTSQDLNTPERVDLSVGAEQLIIMRSHAGIECEKLTSDQFAFLWSFKEQRTLSEAFTSALKCNAKFDMNSYLQICLTRKIIVSFSL